MRPARKLAAEALGSALLLAIIVGSGIMGERLASGNTAIALLANSLATGGGLIVLILIFGPISGAQFNPAVTLTMAATGRQRWREVPGYIAVQIIGAVAGVWIAHGMFGMPILETSTRVRAGGPQMFSEAIATFGLLLNILGCLRHRVDAIPYAVAAYIVSAYWFTASTSFANPAVTIARAMTDSFAGIRLGDAPGFIAAQLLGAAVAALVGRTVLRADASA